MTPFQRQCHETFVKAHTRMVERVNLEQDLLRAAREWWRDDADEYDTEALAIAARSYAEFMARLEAEDK